MLTKPTTDDKTDDDADDDDETDDVPQPPVEPEDDDDVDDDDGDDDVVDTIKTTVSQVFLAMPCSLLSCPVRLCSSQTSHCILSAVPHQGDQKLFASLLLVQTPKSKHSLMPLLNQTLPSNFTVNLTPSLGLHLRRNCGGPRIARIRDGHRNYHPQTFRTAR